MPLEARPATADGCSSHRSVRVCVDRRRSGSTCCVVSTRGGAVHRPRRDASPTPTTLAWCGGRARLRTGQRPACDPRPSGCSSHAPPDWQPRPLWRRPDARRSRARPASRTATARRRRSRSRTSTNARASSRRAGSSGASGSTASRQLIDAPPAGCGRRAACAGRRPTRCARLRPRAERLRSAHGLPPRERCSARSPQLGYQLGFYGHHDWGLSWARDRASVFAGLRERAGWSRARDRRGDGRRTCGRRSTSATSRPGSSTPSTSEYAPRDRRSRDGDEVALIPPVSGGAFLLSDEPLSLDRVVDEVRDERSRRDRHVHRHDARRTRAAGRCTHLDYEAYEGMAESVMEEIAEELRGAVRADCAIAIHHRIGRVAIGETSVVIAVSAPHRAGRARRVQGRDRRAQGARAALEEGGLRGRRGMDRPRLVRRRHSTATCA